MSQPAWTTPARWLTSKPSPRELVHPEIIPQLMQRLLSFLDAHPKQEFYYGKLLLVEVHRVRIRQ
jgi:hypothetical protein